MVASLRVRSVLEGDAKHDNVLYCLVTGAENEDK